jgi:serine/threonine protein kinase
VTWLSDAALDHLRSLASPSLPDGGERYAVAEELGRGGMGVVYRARDRVLDRDVALKVLAVDAAPGAAERMRREARVLARLEHPSIVPVHDVGVLPDGRVFYAMKLVRGERLDAWTARAGGLPALLRAFVRVCEAAAFAHAHGVLHRDLKPQNVMVGPFGEVLVMDWGAARLRDAGEPPAPAPPASAGGGAGATAHGTVLGTPGFMAPEQARGEVERVDERTDVYALGALLGFLLDASEREGDPAPRPLRAVQEKAMREAPEARYPSAAEVAAEVARWLDGVAVAAYREGPMERLARFYARYQAPILLVLVYLVVRLLLIVFRGG